MWVVGVFLLLGLLFTVLMFLKSVLGELSWLNKYITLTPNSYKDYIIMAVGILAWLWKIYELHKVIESNEPTDELKRLLFHFNLLLIVYVLLVFYLALSKSF